MSIASWPRLILSHIVDLLLAQQYIDSTTYGLIIQYSQETLPLGMSFSHHRWRPYSPPTFSLDLEEPHSAPTTDIEDQDRI